ncbi:myo-inositol-1(or 4)-monophosphatase [Actinopolymorpha cephalotaxi]|uniref:inositol-phosphate phosphatase n=1 Tax=Actinopolymorpha cephalotaxi TaxID=504797 RepID=A0A1I2W7Y3_9ACTN|nr:inositol monophosphatase family protein [Actinopolymorpha cephalotaxi]NYH82704.1 myo-inositol-1(or 4)-monophosphatase [Actinopolymorpha cephalotaxi]SFG97505.1 myo-inositol-1(or 4)-monophosphatase [Actinopolymorpha cephalotaxi]
MTRPVHPGRPEDPASLDQDLRDLALAAAHAGSHAILRELRGGELRIDTKAHAADFVTTADKAAEGAILRLVSAARPRDAVLAEESGVHDGDSGVRWLVDPLDGTMNFVHRRRDYAVSVGVERDGRIVAGAVVRPADGDWAAAGGAEVFGRDGTPRVSSAVDLSDSIVGIGLPGVLDHRTRVHTFLGELMHQARDYRRTGSSACELLSVALGAQEGYLGFGVNIWDVAAGIALVDAAGGSSEFVTTSSGLEVLVAGTPEVTKTLVGMVKVI